MIRRTAGRISTRDGASLSLESWGSGTPSVVFVHANGFCKEMWRPVAEDLAGSAFSYSGLAIDQRGHGDSDLAEPPLVWSMLGADAAVAAHSIEGPRIGVGHSSGGAALCMAEASNPGLFDGLVLVEPIIAPPPYRRGTFSSLVELTLRRKASFSSVDRARENYSGKPPFRDWEASALDEYVTNAFSPAGGRWTLKCSPETEAEFYREGSNHDTWDRLGRVECPVVVLAGSESDTHQRDHVEEMAARFPYGRAQVIQGASHFLPMERPDVVAAALMTLAGTIAT